jgi:flagellar biosynthesis protein FlhG
VESLAKLNHPAASGDQTRQPQLVAIASGKGGVGKTMSCLGMAWYLAKIGYRVAAVDMDFGVGNLHLSAGLGRVQSSLDDFIRGSKHDLNDLLIPLEDNTRLSILPSGGRSSSATRLDENKKSALLTALRNLDADVVFLDIGAGSSQNNIDFFLSADHGIAVATTDLSAMTALISFLKKTQIHHIIKYACAVHPELQKLATHEFTRVSELFMAISNYINDSGTRDIIQDALKGFQPAVILNRVEDNDLVQVQRINKNLKRQLRDSTVTLGTIPEDNMITQCRRRGQNFILRGPESHAVKSLAVITDQWQKKYLQNA